ncbi:hypothetical protein H7142_00220 [Candidatus Saccharibacteria bacterium]|nr:hypothetical protein [Candidatus Saccharibacteria bacterium]
MIIFWALGALVVLFGFVALVGAPYVPSLRKEVRAAFDTLYPIGNDDVVVDLGSGDGVVLREAASRGARCIGYELNPLLVVFSNIRLGKAGTVTLGDMWQATLPPDVTLVYVFTVSRDSRKLGRYLQTQANEQNRSIRVMTFGSELKDYVPSKRLKAHSLYEISPN